MMHGSRSTAVIVLLFLGALLQGQGAYAFHSGRSDECKECHGAGSASSLRGSDESSTCLRCHMAPAGARWPVGYYIATNDRDLRKGMPPVQLTPGGDFGYLKKDYVWTSPDGRRGSSSGERHGHNIVAIDYGYEPDKTNMTAPGGAYPSSILSCVSCHDPHAKIATDTGARGAYRLLGGVGYEPSSARGLAFTREAPVAVAPHDYNRSEASTDTRVAYGKGMSEWCSNCHARIEGNSAADKYGHPVGAYARLTAEVISNYNAYVKSGDLTGNAGTSYTSLVPFEEGTDDTVALSQHAKKDGSYTRGPDFRSNVMCLTCHRAHASGWDTSARWNMTADFIVYKGMYPGADNGSPAEQAQGRTEAETKRALYDRPSALYATYQRGLCNKCHAAD